MLARLNDNWGLLNPWRTVSGLQKDFFGLFDEITDGINRYRASFPKMSMDEDEKAVSVKIALPGYDADKLDVEVVSDFLTIRAERLQPELKEDEKQLHHERSFGKIEETIKLPAKVKSGKVSAKYEHGILTITMPKADAEKPRQIKVGN